MALLPDLMTTGQVAEAFGVGPTTVRRWHERGQLVGVELPSGQLRFRREAVEAFLNPPEPQAQAS